MYNCQEVWNWKFLQTGRFGWCMYSVVLVATGGALGSSLRYLITLSLKNSHIPWATALVNVSGSFIIGILSALCVSRLHSSEEIIRPLLIVGFLGGFTTFSSFSMDSLRLLQSGQYLVTVASILFNVLVGLFMAGCGYKLGSIWGGL